MTSEKDDFAKFLTEQGNVMSDNLEEVYQSYSSLISRKFETLGCQWYVVTRTISIFADRVNNGTRFEALLN